MYERSRALQQEHAMEPSLSIELSWKICQGKDQKDLIYAVFEGEKRRKEYQAAVNLPT